MKKSTELAQEIAAKREAADEILKKDVAEVTEEELKQASAFLDDVDALEAEYKSTKDLEDRAAVNAQRIAELKTVQRPAPYSGIQVKSPVDVALPRSYGQVKNFIGKDRQDAAMKAYRFGQWLFGSLFGNQKSAQWCLDNGIEMKAHTEGINTQGGVLVPEEFETTLIDLREQYGVFRQNARVEPMASDLKRVPRRTGGLTAYFTNETASITESTAGWDSVQLTARKLGVLTRFSSELNEDAVVNLSDWLAGEIAYAFAQKEDDCGFNGDGTSTYGGIVGVRSALTNLSGTIANIAGLQVGTGNAYSELTLADFHGVVGKLPVYAQGRAKWFVHNTFWSNVMEKLIIASGGAVPVDIVNGAPSRKFLGYPVVISQVMPATEANSQVCALLGDLTLGAMMGDRRATTLALDNSVYFASDEIALRGTERFDIVAHDVGNASATAASRVPGPIVGLITAAS